MTANATSVGKTRHFSDVSSMLEEKEQSGSRYGTMPEYSQHGEWGTRDCGQLKFDVSLKERPSVDEMVQEALLHMDPTGATGYGMRLQDSCGSDHRSEGAIRQIMTFARQWFSRVAIWAVLGLVFSLEGLLIPLHRYLMIPMPGSLIGGEHPPVAALPPLSLLVVVHALILLLYSPRIVYNIVSCLTSETVVNRVAPVPSEPSYRVRVTVARSGMGTMSKVKDSCIATLRDTIKNRNWIVYSAIVVFYYSCLFISLSFTSPVVVSTVMLTTALLVHVASAHMEGIRIDALILSMATMLGGIMMVLGMTTITAPEAFTLRFTTDLVKLVAEATLMDIVGVLFAAWAAALNAMHMVFVRYLTVGVSASEILQNARGISLQSCENLFIMQCATIVFSLALPSILLDSWSQWFHLSFAQLLALLAMVFFVFMIGVPLRLVVISKCGEGVSAVSAFYPIFLVSQTFAAMILLPASIPNNLWQFIGIFVIQVAITAFVVQVDLRAYRRDRKDEREKGTVQLKQREYRKTGHGFKSEDIASGA